MILLMVTMGKVSCRRLISFLVWGSVDLRQLHHRGVTWTGEAGSCSLTGSINSSSGLQQQCLLWNISTVTLLHIIFSLGPSLMDQSLSETMPVVWQVDKSTQGSPYLLLKFPVEMSQLQWGSFKFTGVRKLIQEKATNIGLSITNVPLECPHPFMSVELVCCCLRSYGTNNIF